MLWLDTHKIHRIPRGGKMVSNICSNTANCLNNTGRVGSTGNRGGIEIKMLVNMTAANNHKPLCCHRGAS